MFRIAMSGIFAIVMISLIVIAIDTAKSASKRADTVAEVHTLVRECQDKGGTAHVITHWDGKIPKHWEVSCAVQ
jgi:hypothetical protein